MPRRSLLSAEQRTCLFAVPTTPAEMPGTTCSAPRTSCWCAPSAAPSTAWASPSSSACCATRDRASVPASTHLRRWWASWPPSSVSRPPRSPTTHGATRPVASTPSSSRPSSACAASSWATGAIACGWVPMPPGPPTAATAGERQSSFVTGLKRHRPVGPDAFSLLLEPGRLDRRRRGGRRPSPRDPGSSTPHPVLRSPAATPLMEIRMPRCTFSSVCPARQRRIRSICRWLSGVM